MDSRKNLDQQIYAGPKLSTLSSPFLHSANPLPNNGIDRRFPIVIIPAGLTSSCQLDVHLLIFGQASMDFSATQVKCEVCGELSEIVRNEQIDFMGNRVQWPKVAVKPDGNYFTIICPKCGERSQLATKRPFDPRD
jgi:ribosomal protein S27E